MCLWEWGFWGVIYYMLKIYGFRQLPFSFHCEIKPAKIFISEEKKTAIPYSIKSSNISVHPNENGQNIHRNIGFTNDLCSHRTMTTKPFWYLVYILFHMENSHFYKVLLSLNAIIHLTSCIDVNIDRYSTYHR